MKEPFSVQNGRYRIPAGPGLGVSLDDDAIDRYRV
jgi:L-alanine-DL-glutamate epimerase-like enolase superfamily enzyme